MNIVEFADALYDRISTESPATTLEGEQEFEQQHIIAPAWTLALDHPEVRVFVHPWKNRERCKPNCEAGLDDPGKRVRGCGRCWHSSKEWATVEAFGTQNNFDLVARDADGRKLALEIKWLTLASRGPNGEFQRFIGQCALAASIFNVVIGVCGFRGQRHKDLHRDDGMVSEKLGRIGVRLVTLNAPAVAAQIATERMSHR